MEIQITVTARSPEEAQELVSRLSSSSTPADTGATTAGATTAGATAPDAGASAETNDVVIADTVRKYAEENGVDLDNVTGTGKNGRILKKDVTAAIPEPEADDDEFDFDEPEDPVVSDDDDFDFNLDDDDAPTGTPKVTSEDVRAAIIKFQTTVREKCIAKGLDEGAAKAKSMEVARDLLSKASGGAATLGEIKESQFADVLEKIGKAQAKLG